MLRLTFQLIIYIHKIPLIPQVKNITSIEIIYHILINII